MARSPILPSNRADPTGVDRLERGAIRELERRIRRVARSYIAGLERIPSEPAVNRRYTFQFDPSLLNLILSTSAAEAATILLEGGEDNLWFSANFGAVAYQRGTAQSFANLGNQSAAYRAEHASLVQLLSTDAYRRRIALIRARQFEEMEGLTGQVRAGMTRALTDGVARGLNPREIARNLNQQAGVEIGRARRIARTEIPTALRRARWDETEDAQEQYGLRSLLLHVSALSPTTRQTHALRHGHLYTVEQVRDWYSQDANAINCKCGQIEVLVDENDQPLAPAIIDRVRNTYQTMKADGRGPWANSRTYKRRAAACRCCA